MSIQSIAALPIHGDVKPDIAIISSLGEHLVGQYVLVRVARRRGPRRPGRGQRHQRLERRDAGGHHRPDPTRCWRRWSSAPIPFDIEWIGRRMDQAAFGNSFAKGALEMALLDLQGQILGVPVYKLLGGQATHRRQQRAGGIAAASSSSAPSSRTLAAERARRMVERGWKAIKVKVGRHAHPQVDVERLKAVREAIGPDVWLSVDANGGYTVEQAIWAAAQSREARRGPVRAADAARRPPGDGRGAAPQRHPDHGRRERLHAAGRPGGDPPPGRRRAQPVPRQARRHPADAADRQAGRGGRHPLHHRQQPGARGRHGGDGPRHRLRPPTSSASASPAT